MYSVVERDGVASEGAAPKPFLATEELVERLKQKGVTFEQCSEQDAADYLAHANNYLRTASYRKLYPRKLGGPHDGDYIGLDFDALRRLSSADRVLRGALREVCIDVEHFARVRLLERAYAEGEDGYAIVSEYFEELPRRGERVTGALSRRGGEGDLHDEYSGDLISHYEQRGYPIWVFLEVIEFGRFCDFWLFCSRRWDDKKMLVDHYTLKSVKALRNAVCHNSCIINGLFPGAPVTSHTVPKTVLDSMSERGIRATKARRAKMRNPRVEQIAATLYASSAFCESEGTRRRHAKGMAAVRKAFQDVQPVCPADGSLVSFLDFILELIDIWAPDQP